VRSVAKAIGSKETQMRIRRLGWAGLELEASGNTALIDPFQNVGSMARFVGEPQGPLLLPSRPCVASVALVTHLHSDHADPAALAAALAADGVVLRPASAPGSGLETIGTAEAEAGLIRLEIPTRVMEPWETVQLGPFTITAIPAADGFGDPQLSWLVAADGQRIIHCGDTLFHGWWWLAKMRHGPIDAAFLPVNGPIVDLPHRQPPSALPAAMDPAQAAEAAALLEAAVAIPIHYDTLNHPPTYVQTGDPAETFARAAAERDVDARILAPGEYLDLAAISA
jgi:L-ascorbate metabolism protein UlaG (beta-lactamase superfamily)